MIIAVAHQKGGTGKSTIATNLAGYLKADMLDLDKQHSSALWNHVRGIPKNEGGAGKTPLRLATLASSQCQLPSQKALPDDALEDFLAVYKGSPDNLLVIDTGGFDSKINRQAIIAADLVITPVAPSGIEIFGLQRFEEILVAAKEATGIDVPCYVLINNVNNQSTKRVDDIKEFVSNRKIFRLLKHTLTRRVAYMRAYEAGKTVVESDAGRKVAAEFIDFAIEIKLKIQKPEQRGEKDGKY